MVVFKINCVTVKDANGKVVYAKVVDGIAQMDYSIPNSFAGKTVDISAVYSGTSGYESARTTTQATISQATPTLEVTPVTESIKTGSTITVSAKVSQGDKQITTGKIVFKLNGKTLKDENGKVIYAQVDENGEVSFEYNIGNLKANSYTLEATFTGVGYDKLISNTTVTVVK